MTKRLTKREVGKLMSLIEKRPVLEHLQAGARLLGCDVQLGENGCLIYDGVIYSDLAVLVDELLLDLGNKQRSL